MKYAILGMGGVGFFGMLLIGFLAGWIAEQVMKRDHGLLTNVLVGIAGSFVGGALASLLGFQWFGFLGNLVVATLGAIAILWFYGRYQEHKRPHGHAYGHSHGRSPARPHDSSPISSRASTHDSRHREAPSSPDRPPSEPEKKGDDLPPIYHTTETKAKASGQATAKRGRATKAKTATKPKTAAKPRATAKPRAKTTTRKPRTGKTNKD